MIQKKYLQNRWNRLLRLCRKNRKKLFIAGGLLLVLLLVIYFLLSRHVYESVREIKDYSREGSDNYNYAEFAGGIIRYSRDGVAFLDYENEEIWNQPAQLQNPEITVNEKAFAIVDSGGNTIMVFTEEGLKGEISTTLPIEKAAVSNQGIVAAILKNESSPKIMAYDTAGNVLVEHQATLQGTGYPVALALSDDANLMSVSYLSVKDTLLKSQVVYYNFGSVGQNKKNNQVASMEYENRIIPTVYFVDNEISVAVSDNGFTVYKGKQIPEETKSVSVEKEIKSTFHSDKYIGFVLKNSKTAGYELRVYNLNGSQVLSEEFKGEYGNVKISDNEIILSEGSRGCIFKLNGVRKFQGDLGMDVSEMVRLNGRNKYLLMNANVVKKVQLAR